MIGCNHNPSATIFPEGCILRDAEEEKLQEQSYFIQYKSSCLGYGVGYKQIDEDLQGIGKPIGEFLKGVANWIGDFLH